MTLTRILPSLRRSLPDPINPDLWPKHTFVTPTDVIVSGIPLLRLWQIFGTPCVLLGSVPIPPTGGNKPPFECTVILVMRITAVEGTTPGLIVPDASLDHLRLTFSETRLINRASTARAETTLIGRLPLATTVSCADDALAVDLPADLRVGDLLAMPGRTITTTRALHSKQISGEADERDPSRRYWVWRPM